MAGFKRTFAVASVAASLCAASAALAQTCGPAVAGATATPILPSNSLSTIASYDDASGSGPRFYAGGSIAAFGGIAMLTPTGWQHVGPGAGGVNSVVYALEVIQDGLGPGGLSLYAGAQNGLFRWNGTTWAAITPSPGTLVSAVVMYDDRTGGGPALHVLCNSLQQPALLRKQVAGGGWTTVGSLSCADASTRLTQRVLVHDEDGPGPLPPAIFLCSGVYSATSLVAGGTVQPTSWMVRSDGQAFTALSNALSAPTNATLPFAGWIKSAIVFDDGAGGGPALYISGHSSGTNPIVRWNGLTQMWDPVGPVMVNSDAAYGMAIVRDGLGPTGARLYVVTGTGFGHVQPQSLVMAWDGLAWAAVRGLSITSPGGMGYHLPAAGGVLGAGRVPALLCAIGSGTNFFGALGCPRCPGDVNLDGAMTQADRNVISANLNHAGLGWSGGDLNGDNTVNALDLALVCPADVNCDGAVTVQDIFDFLPRWFALDPRADVNGSAVVTIQDLFDYLAEWFGGC